MLRQWLTLFAFFAAMTALPVDAQTIPREAHIPDPFLLTPRADPKQPGCRARHKIGAHHVTVLCPPGVAFAERPGPRANSRGRPMLCKAEDDVLRDA